LNFMGGSINITMLQNILVEESCYMFVIDHNLYTYS